LENNVAAALKGRREPTHGVANDTIADREIVALTAQADLLAIPRALISELLTMPRFHKAALRNP